jgi:hypothetical protein
MNGVKRWSGSFDLLFNWTARPQPGEGWFSGDELAHLGAMREEKRKQAIMLDANNQRCCPLCRQPLANPLADDELLALQEAQMMLDSMAEENESASYWESGMEN